MPPKKREKDPDASKNPRMDHIQADHELFLQAFEKPTQIYRYLRTRNMCSPIFLNRTLSYMKHRMSRSQKTRENFKINSLLEKITSKSKDVPTILPGYMNLTFLGFYDKNIDRSIITTVQIETVLVKITHKKRKDSSAPLMEASFGISEVQVNPSEQNLSKMSPSVSVPTDAFTLSGGPLAKSYVLLLRVKQMVNGCSIPSIEASDEEPATKKRKSVVSSVDDVKIYASELVVYDKHNRCLLTDADYELTLQEVKSSNKNSPRKHSTWESVDDLSDCCGNMDAYFKGPSIKFKLNWSQNPCDKLVERPPSYPTTETNEVPANTITNGETTQNKIQIVYQFVYNNNSRQQTEACEDLHCPWCSLDCNELYTLLKHLKLCHSRFTFTYVPISVGARIDVAINELYDGSYTGSPHDLITQPSVCAFSRNGPVRRASVTHILVCHPKRPKQSLSEFLELDDCEYDGQRPFITGHNRLYHHTNSCLPICPKEMDIDSEGENDPEWLRNKTMQMIDEFTDVNEGEKELMKMWNLHVMKHGFVGDCQIPLACYTFVRQSGKDILMQNLYRNFVVHMGSLFDYGLISAVCLYSIIKQLQEMVEQTSAIKTILKESREAQMDNWHKINIADANANNQAMEKLRNTETIAHNNNNNSINSNGTNVKLHANSGVQRKSMGPQRRKGTPTPTATSTENTLRRKSLGNETLTRKRLSLSLKPIAENKN